MKGNCYYLTSLKQTIKDLLENCLRKVCSQFFCQVIGITMDSEPASFLGNLFLFNYEFEWIVKIKNIDHHRARRFGHVYRFVDDLIAMNDNKELRTHSRQSIQKSLS